MRFLLIESRLSAPRVGRPLFPNGQSAEERGRGTRGNLYARASQTTVRALFSCPGRKAREYAYCYGDPPMEGTYIRAHPVHGAGTRARTLTLHYSIWDVCCRSRRG